LNQTRFDGLSSCLSSWPRETISSIPLDCERFGSIPFKVEVAQEVTQLFPKLRVDPRVGFLEGAV
jgi:hypothetical protein